jgi:lipopolysaccharide export system protein LptA
VNPPLPTLFRAIVIACLLALAPGLRAEKADREKEINFTADDAKVDYEKRTGALNGNVVITQGTLTIKANRIDFKQNDDNSLSAVAHGSPVTFRQKRDGSDEYYEGWAQRAEYDGSKEFLELFDNAVLKRGADEIHSNYISYNSATEFFKAEGRPTAVPVPDNLGRSDRVRGTFQPKGEGVPGKPAAKDKAGDKAAPAKENASDKAAPAKDKEKGASVAPPLTLKSSGDLAPAK